MLLLRNFMSQVLVHNQPLLYASPSKDPRGFMGTLPSLGSSKDEKSSKHESLGCFLYSFTFQILVQLFGFSMNFVFFIGKTSRERVANSLAIQTV